MILVHTRSKIALETFLNLETSNAGFGQNRLPGFRDVLVWFGPGPGFIFPGPGFRLRSVF